MSLAALFLSAVLAQTLGPERALEHYDFAVGTPADWKATAMVPPALEKYTSPDGASEILLRVVDSQYPRDPKAFFAQVSTHLAKEVTDGKEVAGKDLVTGGRPARLVAFEGTSRSGTTRIVVARAMVARGLRQYIFVEGRAPQGEAGQAMLAMIERMIGSMRFGLPLRKDEEEALAKLPELPLDVIAGEEYAKIVLSTRKIGWQRLTLRMDKLDNVLAIAWDLEISLMYDDGRMVTKSRGAMTRDGRQQRAEVAMDLEAGGTKRAYRETIGIRDGEATATRDVEGTQSEAKFKVPPRTYLGDAAEVLRRLLVRHQPGVYAFRRLESFQDEPVLDVVEFAAAERGGVGGREQRTITMLAKESRVRLHHYHYGEDGAFLRATAAKGAYLVDRCPKDEALK